MRVLSAIAPTMYRETLELVLLRHPLHLAVRTETYFRPVPTPVPLDLVTPDNDTGNGNASRCMV